MRLLEKRAKEGKPTPSWDNRPELYEGLEPIWIAFGKLHERRSMVMGPDPIPLSEMISYIDELGIEDNDDREAWIELLRAMDNTWLYWARKLQIKETKGRKHGDSSGSIKRKTSHRRI